MTNQPNKTYYTDGTDSFIALHGFEGAARIVSKSLEISLDEARERVKLAQKNRTNEI